MLIFRIITTIINALLLLIFFQAKVDPKGHNMRLGIGLIKYTFDLELIAW